MWTLTARHIRPIKGASLSRATWAIVPTFSLVSFVKRQISLVCGSFEASTVAAKVMKAGKVVGGV